MTTPPYERNPLPWVFEACSPEDATDPAGQPWEHACRGRKPAGRFVMGYGHDAQAADYDAREEAQRYDAREVLGERGETAPPVLPCGAIGIIPMERIGRQRY